MAVTKAQKVRLGIFVVAGLSLLFVSVVVLAGLSLTEQRDVYIVRFGESNVSLSGLDVGSPVKYSGIRVGTVESIGVDPKDVSVIQVKLSLDPGTPVAEDSNASLGSLGITGLKYVELSRGSRSARIREPGEEIPSGASFIDDLTAQAGIITQQVQDVLVQVKALTAPEMKDRLASVLDRTDKLLETTEVTISENRENLNRASAGMAEAAERLDSVLGRVDAVLETGGPDAARMLSEGAALLAELRETRQHLNENLVISQGLLENARNAIGPDGLQKTLVTLDDLLRRGYLMLTQSREDLLEGVGHLRRAAEDMSLFAERIKDDPSLLLLGGEDD